MRARADSSTSRRSLNCRLVPRRTMITRIDIASKRGAYVADYPIDLHRLMATLTPSSIQKQDNFVMPRGTLARIACVCLVWHLSAAAASPLVTWLYPQQHVAAACECPHGTGAMCPMHETTRDRTTCALRSATRQHAVALVSLVAAVGFMHPCVSFLLTPSSTRVESYGRIPLERPLAPDAPPPRD
jgi:hypothetical protein